LEACGAIVAGIALGSLSMKTKSIYQGFLVHVTVAGLMDWLSLRHRHATPIRFWAPDGIVPPPDFATQEALREQIASRIESIAIPILVTLFVLLLLFVLRSHRARLARVL